MAFFRHQKSFAYVGIMLILLPSLFFALPKKTQAIVPVNDMAGNVLLGKISGYTGTLAGSYVKKEFSWDLIAWAAAKAIIHMMVQEIVNWINRDFEGKPLFVTDPGRFLSGTANYAVGVFMDQFADPAFYDLLCSPWRNPVLIGLLGLQSKRKPYRPQCDLTAISQNLTAMANFAQDFANGGWDLFYGLISKPQNNAYGSFLTAASALEDAEEKARAAANTEAQMNKGFLGVKTCLRRTSSNLCAEYQIQSPGSWVEDQLAEHTTSEVRTLELADEINEIVGALAGYLLRQLMGPGGILSQGSGGPGPGTPPAQAPATAVQTLIDLISQTITEETYYRDTKQNSLNTYQQALPVYNTALACYAAYAPFSSAYTNIQNQINNINNSVVPGINSSIVNANNLILQLQNLRNRVAAVTTADELLILNDEFSNLSRSAHTPMDQLQADIELQNAQSAVTGAQGYQNNCAVLQSLTYPPGYTFCAFAEGHTGRVIGGETCSFPGIMNVAYGANGSYVYRAGVAGSISCNIASFGSDPAPNVAKYCFISP